MRKAFTLAEVLITLGIVAVLAAVTIPFIDNVRPDSNKALYLKAYDRLCKCVHQVAMDSSIYPTIYKYNDNISYNTSYYPLINIDNVVNPSFSNYSGTSKLPNIMMDVLGGKGRSYTNFKTNDGIVWMFEDSKIEGLGNTTGNVVFYTPVTINVDKDGSDKIYTSENDNRPAKFKFFITATGEVVPADIYGQMYIATRKQLTRNKKEKDIIKSGIKSGDFKDLTSSGSSVPDATFDIAEMTIGDN